MLGSSFGIIPSGWIPCSKQYNSLYKHHQCWNFRTIYVGQEPRRDGVVVPARQATQAGGPVRKLGFQLPEIVLKFQHSKRDFLNNVSDACLDVVVSLPDGETFPYLVLLKIQKIENRKQQIQKKEQIMGGGGVGVGLSRTREMGGLLGRWLSRKMGG